MHNVSSDSRYVEKLYLTPSWPLKDSMADSTGTSRS